MFCPDHLSPIKWVDNSILYSSQIHQQTHYLETLFGFSFMGLAKSHGIIYHPNFIPKIKTEFLKNRVDYTIEGCLGVTLDGNVIILYQCLTGNFTLHEKNYYVCIRIETDTLKDSDQVLIERYKAVFIDENDKLTSKDLIVGKINYGEDEWYYEKNYQPPSFWMSGGQKLNHNFDRIQKLSKSFEYVIEDFFFSKNVKSNEKLAKKIQVFCTHLLDLCYLAKNVKQFPKDFFTYLLNKIQVIGITVMSTDELLGFRELDFANITLSLKKFIAGYLESPDQELDKVCHFLQQMYNSLEIMIYSPPDPIFVKGKSFDRFSILQSDQYSKQRVDEGYCYYISDFFSGIWARDVVLVFRVGTKVSNFELKDVDIRIGSNQSYLFNINDWEGNLDHSRERFPSELVDIFKKNKRSIKRASAKLEKKKQGVWLLKTSKDVYTIVEDEKTLDVYEGDMSRDALKDKKILTTSPLNEEDCVGQKILKHGYLGAYYQIGEKREQLKNITITFPENLVVSDFIVYIEKKSKQISCPECGFNVCKNCMQQK